MAINPFNSSAFPTLMDLDSREGKRRRDSGSDDEGPEESKRLCRDSEMQQIETELASLEYEVTRLERTDAVNLDLLQRIR